ncbi:hypothetical protein VB834_09270 [Limnoraphis robusta Tam1]|uniref:Uncharacterized protein n=1 Tax=Limnoraphis robusta CCNP1315 TaxID=3110306 RepID=A0ABU5TXK4_9CYAN|nr:hypothetical protein [Limnoraphis robusta]MEA5500359.1 hypothetical protein [Limnoraphis robusta BA-68 BA1]MEA5519559.1 hypothetical protein [Limnoraphis robusta CCNP1315]MEA5539223.1 hypothetical protein [Limnoraphis robusta Tam1]MEA5545827.1 hypothetical protein [Limnoraphis robusta CCNP1324]
MFLNFLVPDFIRPCNQFLIFEGKIKIINRLDTPSYMINFENLKIKNDDNSFGNEFNNYSAFLLIDKTEGKEDLFLKAIIELFDDVKPRSKYRGYLDLSSSGLSKIQTYSIAYSETLKSQLKELFFELVEITTEK